MTTLTHAKPLTPRQAEVLSRIKFYIGQHEHSPTMQELADSLRVSKVTVWESVNALEAKGWITRDARMARSIRVVEVCPTCGRGE